MGASIAANPHYPVIAPAGLRLASSGSAGPKACSPQMIRCGARRLSPAMVWSAPFRGPASP